MSNPGASSRDLSFTTDAPALPSGTFGASATPGPIGLRPAAIRRPAQATSASAAKAAKLDRERALDEFIRPDIGQGSFLGVPINGGVHWRLLPALRAVEAALSFPAQRGVHGITDILGYQGPHHGRHSLGVALDINGASNPYLIGESGEKLRDVELARVYARIALFVLGAGSVIPSAIQGSVSNGSRRDALYQRLQAESQAMRRYFELMIQQTELRTYLETAEGMHNFALVAWPFRIVTSPSGNAINQVDTATLDAVTGTMQQDWVTLTGRSGRPVIPVADGPFTPGPPAGGQSQTGVPTPRTFPYPSASKLPGDPPFVGRDPAQGFLALELSVVTALTDNGFVWGAIAFGAESGDLMHFHHEGIAKQVEREAAASLAADN